MARYNYQTTEILIDVLDLKGARRFNYFATMQVEVGRGIRIQNRTYGLRRH